MDRSIKIALTTSEQIVRKDFSLDPEEARMRTAARHMVRNLTAGMAMITCRDQVNFYIFCNELLLVSNIRFPNFFFFLFRYIDININ